MGTQKATKSRAKKNPNPPVTLEQVKALVTEGLREALDEYFHGGELAKAPEAGTVQTAPPPATVETKTWQIPKLPYLQNMVTTKNMFKDVAP